MHNLLKKALIAAINVYQRTLSPDHGVFKHNHPYGFCRYYPSCSEYTKLSIQKHGVYGLYLGFVRILRCNPFSKGGIDLVK